MIAHVAAAGEDRGRVVLRLDALSAISPLALDAGLSVARAFGSEMESLFVEDRQLFDLAAFPFIRETTPTGGATRSIRQDDIERDVRALGRSLHAHVAKAAESAGVQLRTRTVRDEPMPALAAACAENGPWNVIALAAPIEDEKLAEVTDIFAHVGDMTGVVVVGRHACRRPGPVLVAVEDAARLQPMLRAAARLASIAGGEIRLILIGDDVESVGRMEAEARMALPDAGARIEAVQLASDGQTATRMLLASAASFVVAVFGGAAVPEDGSGTPLLANLECPLMLVR